MSFRQCDLLAPLNFHAVDAATCSQTIKESDLEFSIDMGRFTIHVGHRSCSTIVIVEQHDQQADELSGIWYDASDVHERTPKNA